MAAHTRILYTIKKSEVMLFAGKLEFTIAELSQCSKHRCSLLYVGPRFLYRHIKITYDMKAETSLEEKRKLKGGEVRRG